MCIFKGRIWGVIVLGVVLGCSSSIQKDELVSSSLQSGQSDLETQVKEIKWHPIDARRDHRKTKCGQVARTQNTSKDQTFKAEICSFTPEMLKRHQDEGPPAFYGPRMVWEVPKGEGTPEKKLGIDLREEFQTYEWTHWVEEGSVIVGAFDYTVEALMWEVPIFVMDLDSGEKSPSVMAPPVVKQVRFNKPHFSAWIDQLSFRNGVLFLRLAIGRDTVAPLKVTFKDPSQETDYLDYRLDFRKQSQTKPVTWELQSAPLSFNTGHGAISEEKRRVVLQSVSSLERSRH